MTLSGVEIIIPARLNSQRLPRKMLRADTGKPLIQHTYEAIRQIVGFDPWVATDDHEILNAVAAFGGQTIHTGDHTCGTNRVAEAAVRFSDAQWIVNVQGDEPEISKETLLTLLSTAARSSIDCQTSTVAVPFLSMEDVYNPNYVKVVMANDGKAMYFSRAPIPFQGRLTGSSDKPLALRHIGIYCHRPNFLKVVRAVEQGLLAKAEGLEQLSWMEAGFKIAVGTVSAAHPGIDVEADYVKFVERHKL